MQNRLETAVVVFATVVLSVSGQLPRLRDLAVPRHVFVGSCLSYEALQDSNYTSMCGIQFDLITPENAMKWQDTEPQQNVFDFSEGDASVKFAQQNNQTIRGHNLAWGVYNPSWLENGHFTGSQLSQILAQHIANVAGRYKGQVYCWDVVNEAITDNSNASDPLKTNVWYPAVPDYIDQAFRNASAADPNAKLFYNDYSAEGLGVKSQRVYDMVKTMLANGIPIHGVGLQMHVSTGYYPPFADVKSNIDRLSALGLEVHITEMDVGVKDTSPAELTLQANIYAGMLNVCLSNPSCKSFESWGFTDKYSWLSADKADIFDVNFQPKPAFFALVQALQNGTRIGY